MAEDRETPLEEIAGGAAIGITLLAGLGLLSIGYPWFWIAFPVGFAGLLPLSVGLARWYERRRKRERAAEEPDPREAALQELRRRYAAGELDEQAFEARLDRLLETESIEDAAEYVEREVERTG